MTKWDALNLSRQGSATGSLWQMAGEPHPWLWSQGPFHWDVKSSQVEAQHRCWPSVSLLGPCTPSLLARAFGASPPCMSQVQVLGLREPTPCWILRPGTQVQPPSNQSPQELKS